MKKIYDEMKELSEKYKIEVLSPGYRINQLNSISDNVISISKSMHTKPLTVNVIKNRMTCYITDLINQNDKVKLQQEIDKMNARILSIVDDIQYKMKIENNIIKVLKENKLDFLEILENKELLDKLFKTKEEKSEFYIKVGLQSDNFEYFMKENNLDNILTEEIIDRVIKNRAINIFSELMFFDKFKSLMEDNFDIIRFIPIMMEDETQQILKICLENIECKQKESIESTFVRFDNQNSLDSEENNRYYFNETIKTIILYSNFIFTESDEKVLEKSNIELLHKKKLNEKLDTNLEIKEKSKKSKI